MKSNSCGRLAPSPTGAQHLGNARTYLIAWLYARLSGSRLLLRIEDLDTPRTKPWAIRQAVDDLQWLGLDWDHEPNGSPDFLLQSERGERYREIFKELVDQEQIYPCVCTRKEIELASSAPHESVSLQTFRVSNSSLEGTMLPGGRALSDGTVYPGTCSHRSSKESKTLDRPFAWRFRTHGSSVAWNDKVAGNISVDVHRRLGDFVIHRSSGEVAYQLAVVVDDHDQEVTQVVRGNDLLPSAARQIAIYDYFGWPVPTMIHVPLVRGHDGRRLAKRHGDTRLSQLREIGIPATSIIGAMAWSAGLLESFQPISPQELLEDFGSENDLVSRINPDDFLIPELNATEWIIKLTSLH